jgi:ceramide glucosyltransferase
MLWQLRLAARFPLHRRLPNPGFLPPVTLLKPVGSVDPTTAASLETWLTQSYPGPVQILFGVESAHSEAADLVRHLLAAHPGCDAELVVCPEPRGANGKVSKLLQLWPRIQHDRIVISDADVRAPADLLANLIAPLQDEGVGLVTCLYRLAHPGTLPRDLQVPCGRATPLPADTAASGIRAASQCWPPTTGSGSGSRFTSGWDSRLPARLEAVAVNADFWTQVLQARSLGFRDFALGAVMATSRTRIEASGGLAAIADHLADDFQLGRRVAGTGARIELCPVVVDCCEPPRPWGDAWRHQVRWARTLRACQPLAHFFSLLGNVTLWALLAVVAWATAGPGRSWLVPGIGAVALLGRMAAARYQQCRLTGSRADLRWMWLVPVKDLLQVAVWAAAHLGSTVVWQGARYRVRRDGRLARIAPPGSRELLPP